MKRLIFRSQGEDGSATAEVALLAPVLALILGGVIEVGGLVQTGMIARNAAREGARYAALLDPCTGQAKALAYLQSAVGTRTDVVLPSTSSILVSDNGTLLTCTSTITPGDPVTVFVPVSVRIGMPVIQSILGPTWSVNAAATMRSAGGS
ncbi:MAG TPA: TadE/TadG family type IV pilus assembly protein [Chloroflexota bacterium]